MRKQIYISLILTLSAILFGFLGKYFAGLILVLFPLITFIYLAFNLDVDQSTFIIMWLILISPLIIFYTNNIPYMISVIAYQFIYLFVLILFAWEHKSQNTDNTKSIKSLSKGSFLLRILIPGIIISIALFSLLISLLLHNYS